MLIPYWPPLRDQHPCHPQRHTLCNNELFIYLTARHVALLQPTSFLNPTTCRPVRLSVQTGVYGSQLENLCRSTAGRISHTRSGFSGFAHDHAFTSHLLERAREDSRGDVAADNG